MRVLFMGTPQFAVPSLEALDNSFDVVGVVTRPDAVRGRGKRLEPSPVKAEALKRDIPVVETRRITPEVLEQLRAWKPDVVAVAAFGCILPDAVLELAPLGCVNVHGSLLPRWRGAAPIPRAILAGDRELGVSIMAVVSELDAGDYCLTGSVPADDKSFDQLAAELSELGARLLVEALVQIQDGTVVWTAQDPSQVTYAEKVSKAEMRLDPEATARANLRRVRASSDAAPARLALADKGMRVLKARMAPGLGARPGHLRIERGRVALGCADGVLELLEVKPDGKRAMTARQWAAGVQDDTGLLWSQV